MDWEIGEIPHTLYRKYINSKLSVVTILPNLQTRTFKRGAALEIGRTTNFGVDFAVLDNRLF